VKLYVVRHAAVAVREEIPSSHWHLSPEGRAGADALGGEPYWSGLRALFASPEPKALATAQRLAAPHGLRLYIEQELREVERPWAGENYRDLVRRHLAGEAIDGWEPRDAALARVRRCVADILHDSADAGVVSHGLLLTLYLSDLLAMDGDAAFEQWAKIGFPDVAVVEPETRRLLRGWGGAG
jgi:broad specificity phosphatase PhoE